MHSRAIASPATSRGPSFRGTGPTGLGQARVIAAKVWSGGQMGPGLCRERPTKGTKALEPASPFFAHPLRMWLVVSNPYLTLRRPEGAVSKGRGSPKLQRSVKIEAIE